MAARAWRGEQEAKNTASYSIVPEYANKNCE
jgi:hypothetical protein